MGIKSVFRKLPSPRGPFTGWSLSARSGLPHMSRNMGSTQSGTPHKPLKFPSTGFEVIDQKQLIEEELAEGYNVKNYYPVKQGQVFNNQYQAILKFGFGASSTIWLSKDLHSGEHVALKVCTTNSARERELLVFEHIERIKQDSKSPGKHIIRDLITHFTISGPHGMHTCLVQEPLGTNLRTAELLNPGKFDAFFIKALLCEVLEGLDFLHSEAKVVHTGELYADSSIRTGFEIDKLTANTDIQPSNLMWSLFDKSIFARLEQSELERPSPRKILKDRNIYMSTDLMPADGELRLSDFGEARVEGDREGLIMPDAFRAPEVIMNLAWGFPVDIWALVQTAWFMLEGTPMFECEDEEGQYNVEVQFASMIAALGPAPLHMIREDKEDFLEIWDEDGNWISEVPIPKTATFEDKVKHLQGREKTEFIDFLRRVVRWDPKERPTAKQMLDDAWLQPDEETPTSVHG